MSALHQAIAVARKDFRSELRLRFALNSLGMFVVVIIAVIAFSLGEEKLSESLASGVIWIAMFFSAVTGLGRSFIAEEERGTMLLLRLTARATPVYFGKLLLNTLLALLTNIAIAVLFAAMINGANVRSVWSFCFIVVLSSFGFAATQTIVAAIIARSASRGALYAVLSFPIVLPLIILGVDLLRRAILGVDFSVMSEDLLIMTAYIIAMVALSYVLFDVLWKE